MVKVRVEVLATAELMVSKVNREIFVQQPERMHRSPGW